MGKTNRKFRSEDQFLRNQRKKQRNRSKRRSFDQTYQTKNLDLSQVAQEFLPPEDLESDLDE